MFQFHPYFIPVLLSTVISGYITLYSFQRRKVRGAAAFSLVMFLVFVWSFFYMCELGTSNFALEKFFLRLQYLAIPFVPLAVLYFVLEYGGYNRILNMKVTLALLVPMLIAFILIMTNGFHHLFFLQEYMVVVDGIVVRGFIPGPAYIFTTIYRGFLLFAAATILVQIHLSSEGIQKIQSGILIGALLAPVVVGFLYHMGITPYPFLDFTAIIFPISGLCVMVGLFRYRFFDIVPLPKQVLFSSLSEGIMVLDEKMRIIDINSAARAILGEDLEADGSVIFDKDTFLNKYMERFHAETDLAFLAKIKTDAGERYYAVSVTPVIQYQNDPVYRIVVLRDITAEKRYERELEKSKSSLRIANEKISLLNSITRHDILNNITVLSAYADLIGEQIQEEGKGLEYLGKMNMAIELITRQIRFTADYQDMGVEDPIWQELAPLIADARKSLGDMAKEITFNIDLPEGIEVYADMLLSKVFYNLFENSIRHGETVTEISVSFEEKQDGSGVVIVADNGAGISDEIKKEIFTKGFGKNTGLGLFLVSEILSITKIGIFETGKEGEDARFEMVVHPKGWRVRKGE
ncbi:MAG: PAS domain S-box protein [Methanomicrobiaceae archaeon]|nr:PAS domain S-box protein [Methanomicrobiaceae archaeon]